MSFSSLMFYFALYSVIGWTMETVYCSFLAQKFVHRGFLIGPVCPIYGFGALCVVWVLSPFHGHPELVFLFGIILTSVLEYTVSVLLEKLFKKSWWDYSDRKFNVNGRICIRNSAFWGGLSVLLIYVLQPFFAGILTNLPETILTPVSLFLLLLFGVDLVMSVQSTLDFNREMRKLSELTELIDLKRIELKASVEAFREEQKEKLESELTELIAQQEERLTVFLRRMHRILDAFPHMRLHSKDKLSLRDRLLSSRWLK